MSERNQKHQHDTSKDDLKLPLIRKFINEMAKKLREAWNTEHVEKPDIQLENGQFAWTVYIDGTRNEWKLNYQGYSDLPFDASDYRRILSYKGQRFRLLNVLEGQLQVSTIKD